MELDKKIYKDYLNGSNEAFEILYNKYKNKIHYFVFNIIKDYEKAEDITQEVFIYVMNNKCKDDVSFKYYIYLIAKSRAISYLNIENRRDEITQKYLSNKNIEEDEDLLNIIIKQENKKELLDAINKLEDRYKNAMYLVKIEELSYKQAAEILGEAPQNIKNLIHRGKKELRKHLVKDKYIKMNKVSKVIILVICTGILVSGVVFAKDIQKIIDNLKANIFGTYNDGITTAIENDYIDELDMDYVISNNIKVKVNSILLDDYNLGIIYDVTTADNEQLKDLKISQIGFKNLLIVDENNNLLHAEYEDRSKLEEYCNANNLDIGMFYSGLSNGETIKKIVQDYGNGTFLVSDLILSEKFPDSKKIYISFDALYFMNKNAFYIAGKVYKKNQEFNEEANPKNYVKIDGKWLLEIDLEKTKEQRKSIEYIVANINDENTSVIKCSLSMTGMKFELITNSDKIDFEKLQSKDKEKMNVTDLIPFNECYVETSDDNKFFEIGQNGYENLEDGKIRYYTTFNYTYFNKQENIKIVLPTNTGEEIVIEMKEEIQL